MKVCPRCKKELPLSEFHKDKHQPDGHHAYCKECKRTWFNQYRKDNPEKMRVKDVYDKYRTQRYLKLLRLEVLRKLSDPIICGVCGFEDIRVLDIDHINGD